MLDQDDVGKRRTVLLEGAVGFTGTVDAVDASGYSFWMKDCVFTDVDRYKTKGPWARIRMDSVIAVTPVAGS